MTEPKRDKNPTLSDMSEMVSLIDTLGTIKSSFSEEDRKKLDILTSQISIVRAAERFNDLFKSRCWILNDYLSAGSVEEAVSVALDSNFEKAEQILVDSINSSIDLFMMHLQTAPEFDLRKNIFASGKKHYENEEYFAVTLLLLTSMDGVVNDISNLGLSAEKADLEVWDSITQHSDALSYIHSEFLTKSRKKTNTEEIFLPYRHGILHGRDVNFGSKLLAAKCWNLIFVLRTWYKDKKNEDFKAKEIAKRDSLPEKNRMMTNYLDSFRARKYIPENKLEQNSPAGVCYDFLESWRKKRWGKIVPLLYSSIGKSIGKECKYTKEAYSEHCLLRYKIKEVEHDKPCGAKVLCVLSIQNNHIISDYKLNLSCMYCNEELDTLPENHPDGKWYIIQNSLSKILF